MTIKARNKRQKHQQKDSVKRGRKLVRRLELLSENVPETILSAMQLQAVAWSIPEWVKLGPSQPSKAQVTDLLERSVEAQIDRLAAYWKGVGRNV